MTVVLAASLVSSTLIGYLAAALFLPNYRPRWADLPFKICLGAGLGAGVSSCLYFLIWLLIGPSTKAYVFAEVLFVGALGTAYWFVRDVSVIDNPRAKPAGWFWLLLGGFLVALMLAISMFAETSAASPYGEWDAWSIWNLRAEFLAQPDASWRNAFSPLLNRLAGGGATHPDYPLLVSGYVARCWNLTGSNGDPSAPVAVAALFFFATVGLAVSALALLRGWSAAMIGGLILLGTAGFLMEGPFQYADVPLAFYYQATFVLFFLADAAAEGRRRALVLAGLAMGLAAWTKNEGLVFALLSGIGFAVYAWISRRIPRVRALALLVSGAAAPLAIALYFKFFLAPATGTFANMTAGAVAHRLTELPRYAQIAKAFWDNALLMGSGIAHPALSLAVLAGCLGIAPDRRRSPIVIASLATWLAMLIAYLVTYAITPLDLTWHLGTSMGRLLGQLWPSLVFLSLTALRTAEETAIAVQQPVKAARVPGKKKKKARAG
jgi:hypothetical protein